MKIKSIKRSGVKPTWDICVDSGHEYVMGNGIVSHNTSSILGNEASTEAQTSNMYTRRILAGEFICINKHLVKKLCELGIWNDSIRNKIIINNGSVVGIDEIPVDVQNVYKTTYEVSQKDIIDIHRERAPYIDQTQSMNIWMSKPNLAKLTSMHFYGWGGGVTKDLSVDSVIESTNDEIETITNVLNSIDAKFKRNRSKELHLIGIANLTKEQADELESLKPFIESYSKLNSRLEELNTLLKETDKWKLYGTTPELALKTGSYYLRSKAASDAQKFTVKTEAELNKEPTLQELIDRAKSNNSEDPEDCMMCSG